MDYLTVKAIHRGAVLLSLAGFVARGFGVFSGARWVRTRAAKTLPHVVDTVLLVSALALVWMLGLNPFTTPWLLAKIIGLVVYIGLGMLALRPGRPLPTRAAAWGGALAVFAWIVAVAINKDPGLVPSLMHPGVATNDPVPAEVSAWRKLERQRLVAERQAMGAAERQRCATAIEERLGGMLADVRGMTVAIYWPFRGEPVLRHWIERMLAGGAVCALPVVVERHAPLVFRAWHPGARLERGIWNIPVPADGAPVLPDVIVAPVVGFDGACWRLGYGGGFYDRTLAALARRPRTIGVGYARAAMPTIRPQPHDIALDAVVTETGIVVRS